MNGEQIAQLVVVVATAPLAWFGARFRKKQNSGALGGAMSRAKAYWLCFAIWLWFVLSPAVGFAHELAPGAPRALAAFGVFMWLRGAAEMIMLYVTKNWRPPMGITHDVLCILVIAGFVVAGGFSPQPGGAGVPPAGLAPAADPWPLALCALVFVSLIVEIHHAYSFFHAVAGRTTGEDGVWFADEEHERFRKINRNTRIWNVILTAGSLAFVVHWLVA